MNAAGKLGHDWVGIDPAIAGQLAISLIRNRLQDIYGRRMKFVSGGASSLPNLTVGRRCRAARLTSRSALPNPVVRIISEPTTPNEAATLAGEDKYQFQWWALGLVGARPVEQKKGADHGIDGKILFALFRRGRAATRSAGGRV